MSNKQSTTGKQATKANPFGIVLATGMPLDPFVFHGALCTTILAQQPVSRSEIETVLSGLVNDWSSLGAQEQERVIESVASHYDSMGLLTDSESAREQQWQGGKLKGGGARISDVFQAQPDARG